MHVRQSDIKAWQRCPLAWKYQNIDLWPEEQSGSSVFGSALHDCMIYLETTRDLPGAIQRFEWWWTYPDQMPKPRWQNEPYRVDYYVKGTSWRKFMDEGRRVLEHWWAIIQWDSDHVLAREYEFDVPVVGTEHRLSGTVDKLALRYRAQDDCWVVLIDDYKTNNKTPTYDYLAEDIQFTAYSYATTQAEFWTGIENGAALFQRYRDYPRYGEWVQLRTSRRMDAGVRTPRHYERMRIAVDALALSIAMRIFVPNISGETCRYCDFRKLCGLPEIEEAP